MPDSGLAERWNAFLEDARFATHYVTPNYFLDPYVRQGPFAVLACGDDGEINAVATGIMNDGSIVSGMFSRPQVLFRSDIDRTAAAGALSSGIDELDNGNAGLIDLFAWEETPEFGFQGMKMRPSNDSTSVVMLDLSAGADAIFLKFSQTRRNEIRKAIRQNVVEVKILETEQELNDIYQIHCEWNARKGNEPDSFEQMQTASEQTGNRQILIAKVEGKVVAGSFYRFCPGGVVEYSANFSIPEYQRLRPNDLIGWRAIEWACAEGFSHFSMGGSHLFLRRFGGEIVKTFRYRSDRTRFRRHDLYEGARDLSVGVFRMMPENVRSGVKKILSK